MTPKRQAVYLVWLDSGGHSGWQDPETLHQTPMRCETIGWYVSENEKCITLALNGCFDGTSAKPFGEFVTVPKCSIVKRRRFRLDVSAACKRAKAGA